MRDCVVLEDGYVVYLETISTTEVFDKNDTDILFNGDGRVARFKSNQLLDSKYYIALFNIKSEKFKGYYPEFTFLANSTPSDKQLAIYTSDHILALRYFKILQPIQGLINHEQDIDENSRVLFVNKYAIEYIDNNDEYKVRIDIAYRSFLFKKKVGEYEGINNLSVVLNRICLNGQPLSYDTIEGFPGFEGDSEIYAELDDQLANYYLGIRNKGFKDSDNTIDFTANDESVVLDVTNLFYQLLYENTDFKNYLNQNGLMTVFVKHLQNCSINSELPIDRFHTYYNRTYFSLLRLRLLEFKSWVNGVCFKPNSFYKLGLRPSIEDFVTRIVALFTQFDLSTLDMDTKKDLLNKMVKKNLWISGRWWPYYGPTKLTEEEVIVKIVSSIAYENSSGVLNYNDINEFLGFLVKPYTLGKTKKTLYEVLYSKIHDAILLGDDGQGSRGLFVKAVYLLWYNSKYNPNSEENESISVNYPYTSYNAQWRFDDPNQANKFDEKASPNLINYESEKILLWYVDNYRFAFKGKQIVALVETQRSFSDSLLTSFINALTPIKLNPQYKYAPFGYYHIFQPVSVRSSDSLDTIIKIPAADNLNNPCDVTDEKNKNSIPIFYLKYLDDVGDYSDFKETIGVTLDVVLTFTGIGNITKARHLTKASVVRRYLTGGAVTTLEKQLLVRAFRGISFASWEIILGTASILYNLTTNSCQDYNDPCNPPQPGTDAYEQFQQCMAIQKWLFALEILTMSGDLLAKRYMRRASRDLQPHLPEDMPVDNKNFINGLANIDGAFNDFLNGLQSSNPSVYNKVNNLPTQEKKFAFMFDFEGRPSALSELNANPQLIDDWAEIVDELSHFRKEITYLKSYRRFSDKPYEVIHITDFTNGSTTGGFRPVGAHGGKNLTNGVIRDPNLPPPSGQPPTTVFESKNGHITYKNIYFNKPGGTFRKSKQTIWNPLWDDNRIKAEMATAFKNKKLKKPTQVGNWIDGYSPPPQYTSIYMSELSDGTKVEFQVVNFGKDPVTNSIKTDYLKYFKLILK